MLNNGFIMNNRHIKRNIYNISDKEIKKDKFTINKNNFYSTNELKNNQVVCLCCQKK